MMPFRDFFGNKKPQKSLRRFRVPIPILLVLFRLGTVPNRGRCRVSLSGTGPGSGHNPATRRVVATASGVEEARATHEKLAL